MLFRITHKDATYYVEAEGYGDAVGLWIDSPQTAHLTDHGDDQPERVSVASRDPVIRRAP